MTQQPLSEGDVLDALARAREAFEQERRAGFAPLGVPAECAWPATQLYHRNSALGPHWQVGMTLEEVEQHTASLEFAEFTDRPSQRLPADVELGPMTLREALASRRSCRDYSEVPIRFRDLATLLVASCGVTFENDPIPRRAAPSGGALYPVETYVLALAIDGLDPGIYHFAPLGRRLTALGPIGQDDLRHFLQPGLLATPVPLIVVLTARFARTARKYLERGYRFALLEAGHIGQNLCTTAVALGLGAVCLGGFWDAEVTRLLTLDPDEEGAVHMVMFGNPVTDGPARN